MRDVSEWDEAWAALQYALAATNGPDEFLRRLRLVPRWLWDKGPEAKEAVNQEVICAAVRTIKELASRGNDEATEYLMAILEDNPFLQLLFLSRQRATA